VYIAETGVAEIVDWPAANRHEQLAMPAASWSGGPV
jgi:hypothetical protein